MTSSTRRGRIGELRNACVGDGDLLRTGDVIGAKCRPRVEGRRGEEGGMPPEDPAVFSSSSLSFEMGNGASLRLPASSSEGVTVICSRESFACRIARAAKRSMSSSLPTRRGSEMRRASQV